LRSSPSTAFALAAQGADARLGRIERLGRCQLAGRSANIDVFAELEAAQRDRPRVTGNGSARGRLARGSQPLLDDDARTASSGCSARTIVSMT
jgi:hypothetical protein